MNAIKKPESGLQILMVRSGSTDLDEQGRITGTLDVPLSALGEKQALEIAQDLSGMEIDAIYYSPGSAARQTAQFLSQLGKPRFKVDDDLANLDYGLWHGKRTEELKSTQPRLYRQWQEHPETVCPPGGETIDQARERISRVLSRLRKKYRAGVVVIIVPEPLASLIRRVNEESNNADLWSLQGHGGNWEWLKMSSEAVA